MINEVNRIENGIPDKLQATGQDRFNYLAKYGTSNIQIQAVIEFDQQLDADILKKAVRLSLDAEPILGCKFVEDEKVAYWKRFEDLEGIKWFGFELADNKRGATEQFLKSSFAFEGQQVYVQLIRAGEGDTLCVKINHSCSDGAGVKEYLQLLAGIYSKLREDSGFQPVPNLEGRRDQKHYFDALGIQEPLALFNPKAEMLPPTWAFPYHGIELKEMHISMRRFYDKAFDRIKAFGKAHGVTVNTIILTAYFRSLFKLITPPAGEDMEIYVTMDLRKAFEGNEAQAICNLSSFLHARTYRVEGESFMETLKRVSASIEELKHVQAGLPGAVVMEALGVIDYSKAAGFLQTARQQAVDTGKSSPLLSNMGVISPLHFGQIVAKGAYMVAPAMYAPGFMMCASTYNRTLTLEVSFYEPSHSKQEVEACLEYIEKELRSLLAGG